MHKIRTREMERQIIELHDQGIDTDTVMKAVDLPWFHVQQVLEESGRSVRVPERPERRPGRRGQKRRK